MSTTPLPTRWDDLKQRLQQTMLTTQHTSSRDLQRKTDAYRQRAALLAAPKSADNASVRHTQTLIIMLGEQRFGIPLHHVMQVYPDRPLTHIPRTPSWISGIANFEGLVRAVIDLAELLNVSVHSLEEGGKYLLVRSLAKTAMLRVSTVEGIRNVDFNQLVAPDQQSDAAKPGLIVGLTSDHLIILCVNALLEQMASPSGVVS
jgi:chemotaxis signal transduction protein